MTDPCPARVVPVDMIDGIPVEARRATQKSQWGVQEYGVVLFTHRDPNRVSAYLELRRERHELLSKQDEWELEDSLEYFRVRTAKVLRLLEIVETEQRLKGTTPDTTALLKRLTHEARHLSAAKMAIRTNRERTNASA